MDRNRWKPHPTSLEYILFLENALEKLPEKAQVDSTIITNPLNTSLIVDMYHGEFHIWPEKETSVIVRVDVPQEAHYIFANSAAIWFSYEGTTYHIHFMPRKD